MRRGNAVLCALRELLSKEWAGDHVFFMGDEKSVPADTDNETLSILYEQTIQAGYPADAYGTVLENYKNVSGLFEAAESEVRQEIQHYLETAKDSMPMIQNEYGVDISNPFEGLFSRMGLDFRYTINHTKQVCYSFEDTKILNLDHSENYHDDPLPILMGYGRVSEMGTWVGDLIGVGDEVPDGYELLKELYLDW